MIANPMAVIAELTHRCPLHCIYCSNPLQLAARALELTTQEWSRVFGEAAELGVLHVHLTGGEPLAREDIVDLVAAAHDCGLYTNLITSALGLTQRRLGELVSAGLDHIQVSFQDSREDSANLWAGAHAHTHKLQASKWIQQTPLAFTVNLVVHRLNLDRLEEMIAFVEQMRPHRMEIANAQYYGWALANRSVLMPTREQVEHASVVIAAAASRLEGQIRVESVVPDYYASYPKACMGGWGRRLLLIDPSGSVMPCHAAAVIPGIVFESVREKSLASIWSGSAAFQQFRGEEWMREPCRSCVRRSQDFGGCRCQAMILAGDASAADPACTLSPAHATVAQVVGAANAIPVSNTQSDVKASDLIYRRNSE